MDACREVVLWCFLPENHLKHCKYHGKKMSVDNNHFNMQKKIKTDHHKNTVSPPPGKNYSTFQCTLILSEVNF